MNVTVKNAEQGNTIIITTGSRFDFNSHKEFRDAYSSASPDSRFTIDMKNTSYMDSSALGMILLLREFAGGNASRINIVNCDTEILKVFQISNFDQLFSIS